MERRKVLKTSLAFLGTTTLLSLGYPVFRYLGPGKNRKSEDKITMAKEAIPPGEAREIIVNGTPVVVIHRRQSGFIALSRICTHLGCLVGYDKYGERLICPCHAGVFDLAGKMIAGPASEPLRRYPVTLTATEIIIG
jgi:cytochrome b6-f complex iron-sulfur subunit